MCVQLLVRSLRTACNGIVLDWMQNLNQLILREILQSSAKLRHLDMRNFRIQEIVWRESSGLQVRTCVSLVLRVKRSVSAPSIKFGALVQHTFL
jgi:cell division inhibitor SulA